MGYIRDNLEYDISMGINPKQAAIWAEAEKRCGHDGGYCNPRKVKEFNEACDEIERSIIEESTKKPKKKTL